MLMTIKEIFNSDKPIPRIIKEIIHNIRYFFEERTINPKVFNLYFHDIFIYQMDASFNISFEEQKNIFIKSLKKELNSCNYIIPIEYLSLYDNFDCEVLFDKDLYFKFDKNDNIEIYIFNDKCIVDKFKKNIFNDKISSIQKKILEIKKPYKDIYFDLNKVAFYNILEIERAFFKHKFIVRFVKYSDNILDKPSSLYFCNNNNVPVIKNIDKLKKVHKVIIVKNSFCFDTIPSAGCHKYFNKNLDDNMMYFDSGIHTNIQGFMDWRYGNISISFADKCHLKRPKIIPHSLLNYESKHLISYEKFCEVNNLDKNKKLAVFFLCDNHCYGPTEETNPIIKNFENLYDSLINKPFTNWKNFIKTYNEKVELFKDKTRYLGSPRDLWVIENFIKIKEVFSKLGYNLIIKEHRKDLKQIKHFLDYVSNFDSEFNLYGDSYKKIYLKEYKKWTDEKKKKFNIIYPYIVSNKYECEIFEYADRAIVSSWTSIGNSLYLNDIKTLYIDTLSRHPIHSWSKTASSLFDIRTDNYMGNNKMLGMEDLLYGIMVDFVDFKANFEKYITNLINYNEKYIYKDNHPFFGNGYKKTNYDFFDTLLNKIDDAGFFNETNLLLLPRYSTIFNKLVSIDKKIGEFYGKIYYHLNNKNNHYHLYIKNRDEGFIFLGNIYREPMYLCFIVNNIFNFHKKIFLN